MSRENASSESKRVVELQDREQKMPSSQKKLCREDPLKGRSSRNLVSNIGKSGNVGVDESQAPLWQTQGCFIKFKELAFLQSMPNL
jgi:hypothetical protein